MIKYSSKNFKSIVIIIRGRAEFFQKKSSFWQVPNKQGGK